MKNEGRSAQRAHALALAISRIEHGRCEAGVKLSITSVARLAGVSPSLIHNSYPDIAATIREKVGVKARPRAEAALECCQGRNKVLRDALAEAKKKLARLASVNEVLLIENYELKAQLQRTGVRALATASAKAVPRRD